MTAEGRSWASLILKIKPLAGFSLLIAFVTTLITSQRLFYGADFTDEAFYVAIPYRFVLGAKPFVDEMLMQQTSTFITLPFIKLYFWLVGSSTGLVLFTRFLYLVFMFLVAVTVFMVIKNILRWEIALIVVLPSIAFIYFNIPNLSYNTLGIGFLTMGLFLGSWVFLKDKSHYYLSLAGLCHGLAVIAYPSLVIAALLYAVILILLSKRLSYFLWYCLGAFLATTFLIVIILKAGISNFFASLAYTNSVGVFGGGLAKIEGLLISFWNNYPYKPLLALFLVITFLIWKVKPAVTGYALLLVPLVPLHLYGFPAYTTSAGYISYYSLLAPYFLLFIGHNKIVRQLFYGIWIPSFIAGVLTAYASSNGYLAATVGLFPGSLVTSIFLSIALSEIYSGDGRASSVRNALNVLSLTLVVVFLLAFQFQAVYRDDNIAELNTRFKSGAYYGLYTTEEKKDYLTDLAKDIALVAKPDDKVLFYDNFPVGYLLTSLRPATNLTWINPKAYYPTIDRESTINYFKRRKIQPDLAVRIDHLLYAKNSVETLIYPADDPINNFVESPRYQIVLSRENYVIYRRTN